MTWEKAYCNEYNKNRELSREIGDLASDIHAARRRIAGLEAERGIPARCPECGEPVDLWSLHTQWRIMCSSIECKYKTEWLSKSEDAWRAHRANCDAREG